MKPRWWQHEDWLAVWLGALFIAAVLAGVRLAMPVMKWGASSDLAKVFSPTAIAAVAVLCVVYLITSLPGILACGGSAIRYIIGFPVVFALAWLAQIAAGNATVSYWGVEYVIFALAFGLLISNTIGLPEWLKEAARTEY